MVGRIQYKTNEWNLKFEYANNYAIAGQKQFTWIGKSNQDYFLISVAFVMTWEGEYKKKSN
jgi:hypothetical protein